MKNLVIIDYGAGNLLSVHRALKYLGLEAVISSDANIISSASKIILPGVGAFGDAMNALHHMRLVEPIKLAATNGIPILGICLGMQLLLDESEEFGLSRGLGLISGKVLSLSQKNGMPDDVKIPNIGWRRLLAGKNDSFENGDASRFKGDLGKYYYFVHSYYAEPKKNEHILSLSEYGGVLFPAVIGSGKIVGCQFHPEKSGPNGLNFLRDFCFD